VRQKMMYSSTKNTMTKQLGDSLFVDSLYANHLSDLTYDAYQKHLASKSDKVQPLTNKEIELNKIKMAENGADISISTKKSFNNGISLPLVDDSALKGFGSSVADSWLVFRINEKEEVDCQRSKSFDDLLKVLPNDSPRFSLFQLQSPSGSEKKTVFLYTCPASSPVRQKMFYSAAKSNVIDSISKVIGATPEVKVRFFEHSVYRFLSTSLHTCK
jgi:twinfilin